MFVMGDIDGEIYKKFIEYSISKSDTFMVVAKHCYAKVFDAQQHMLKYREFLSGKQLDDATVERFKKMELESKTNIEIFKNRCCEFIDSLRPFLIKQRHNAIWPSTKAAARSITDYDINLYKISEEVIQYLLQPGSFLNWCYPYYPEDLSFFSQNFCWAYSSSHEGYIQILPSDVCEYNKLRNLGIAFDNEFIPNDDKSDMYFEEY